MARITFSLSDELAEKAKARADEQRRSLSNYVVGLIEVDFRAPAVAPELVAAAAELRSLRLDPVIVLRDALAEIERDTANQPKEAA